ncbi:hypothetical protein B7R22_17065 [Subtercola boreus]|uniref:DUF4031 domain-containing protein n=1 Tax=Subtercola boreus TaxID=120213 RepID=A0A3E0VR16_9MICO|nr:DUF4031 domain-containing protein [Subtercola boreus]RFA12141.1 hypothetical protein B7R22_17065 [Subtercola boreus]
MAVYVDNMNAKADVPNGAKVVRGVWCHMTADTSEELLVMADKIGMRRSWVQYPGTWKEHFDVTLSKRKLAVSAGALEVSMRDGVIASRQRWEAAHPEASRGLIARLTIHDEAQILDPSTPT